MNTFELSSHGFAVLDDDDDEPFPASPDRTRTEEVLANVQRARLEAMRHVLHVFRYGDKDVELVMEPDSLIVGPASRIFEDGGIPGAG